MKTLVGIVLVVLTNLAQADPVRNGLWWSRLNEYQQQAYITGVFDGMSADVLLMASDSVSARVAQNEGSVIVRLFKGIDSNKTLTNLAAFYKERRNQPIIVSEAICLTAMQRQVMSKQQEGMLSEAIADARKRGSHMWLAARIPRG